MTSISSRKQPSILWAARVGPYDSPYAAHPYFSLPFCRYIKEDVRSIANRTDNQNLGELMGGYAWEPFARLPSPPAKDFGPINPLVQDPRFPSSQEWYTLQHAECTTGVLNEDQAKQLAYAVEHQWFYTLFLEKDLPVWGFVGEMLPVKGLIDRSTRRKPYLDKLEPYIYTETSLRIEIDYEGELVKVDLTSDHAGLKVLKSGKSYDYKMAVEYSRVRNIDKGHKYDRYIDHEFFNHDMRKFSAKNSLMMVFFLLLMAVAAVHKIWKHNTTQDDTTQVDVEKGTAPLLQSDTPSTKLDPEEVFRPPVRVWLLAVLLGNGWHILTWVVVMMVCFKDVNPLEYDPGRQLGLMIYLYAATSIVAGYISAFYLYQQQRICNDETNGSEGGWKAVMIMTSLFVPLLIASTLVIHAVAAVPEHAIHIISAKGAGRLLTLWLGGFLPSNMLGTFVGRWHQASCTVPIGSYLALSFPPRKYRQSKLSKWRRAVNEYVARKFSFTLAPLGGILAFGVMFIEMFYIFTSFWKYKYYLVSWVNFTMFFLLIIVLSAFSACLVIASMSNPNNENTPRSWQWNAFASGASTGGYVFLYSIYYFTCKTSMEGTLSIIHYFGTVFVLSVAVALSCGAVAHSAAYQFVSFLYSNIKSA